MNRKRKINSQKNITTYKRGRLYKTDKFVKKRTKEALKKKYTDYKRVKEITRIIKDIEDPGFTLPLLLSIIMYETYENNKNFSEDLTNEELLKELKVFYPFFFT